MNEYYIIPIYPMLVLVGLNLKHRAPRILAEEVAILDTCYQFENF